MKKQNDEAIARKKQRLAEKREEERLEHLYRVEEVKSIINDINKMMKNATEWQKLVGEVAIRLAIAYIDDLDYFLSPKCNLRVSFDAITLIEKNILPSERTMVFGNILHCMKTGERKFVKFTLHKTEAFIINKYLGYIYEEICERGIKKFHNDINKVK